MEMYGESQGEDKERKYKCDCYRNMRKQKMIHYIRGET